MYIVLKGIIKHPVPMCIVKAISSPILQLKYFVYSAYLFHLVKKKTARTDICRQSSVNWKYLSRKTSSGKKRQLTVHLNIN